MSSHQRMFNTGLLLTPCNRQKLGFFLLITAFFCLCETCWATSLCSKFCFPFCSFLPAAALFLGRSPEANLLTGYSFLIVKYKQKHNQDHVGLLRAIAVSVIAYTKKTWLALKWRKIQLAEERPSLPFTSALGKCDEHTRVCLHCHCHQEQPFITMYWAQSGFRMKQNTFLH